MKTFESIKQTLLEKGIVFEEVPDEAISTRTSDTSVEPLPDKTPVEKKVKIILDKIFN